MGNKKSSPRNYLSEKDLLFLEANTSLNREKILTWHEAFIKDCPDGKLNHAIFAFSFIQFMVFYQVLAFENKELDLV